MDCFLAEKAGVKAVRILSEKGLCKIVNQRNGGAGRRSKTTAAATIEVLSSAWGTKFMRKSEYKKGLPANRPNGKTKKRARVE